MHETATQAPLVSIFPGVEAARAGYTALREAGVNADRIGVLGPFRRTEVEPTSGLAGVVSAARSVGDEEFVLRELGVPDGWLHFYLPRLRAGAIALLVQARPDDVYLLRIVREQGGTDVEMPGERLVRGAGEGERATALPPPPDVTRDWTLVRSYYRTLWAEHFGVGGGEFEAREPIYRWAWEQANQPDRRGLAWGQVHDAVREAWQRQGWQLSWSEALPLVRDVWDDVAETARQPEGGEARRVSRPLDEQA